MAKDEQSLECPFCKGELSKHSSVLLEKGFNAICSSCGKIIKYQDIVEKLQAVIENVNYKEISLFSETQESQDEYEGYVVVRGKRIDVKNGELKIQKMGLYEMSEIMGLEFQTFLQTLWITQNYITEIKGIENLINL